MFVLFVISVNIRLILVPDLLPKTYCKLRLNCILRYIFRVLHYNLTRPKIGAHLDWSVIWHNFDVIESSTKRKEEREERKNDKSIVDTKESLKGSRKETPPARHCWS